MGHGSCLLCTDRGEEPTRLDCIPWYHLFTKRFLSPPKQHRQQVHLLWRLQVDHRSHWISLVQHRWHRLLASPHQWDKRPFALAIGWGACSRSGIRHTASMASPNFPRFARPGQWPVRSLHDLNIFPSIENAMAHQRHLEQLQLWSPLVAPTVKDDCRADQWWTWDGAQQPCGQSGKPGLSSPSECMDKASVCLSTANWVKGVAGNGTTSAAASNALSAATQSHVASEASTSALVNRAPSSSSAGPLPLSNQPFHHKKELKICGSKAGMRRSSRVHLDTAVKIACRIVRKPCLAMFASKVKLVGFQGTPVGFTC